MFNRRHIAKVASGAALAVVLTASAASATTLRASSGHQAPNRHHGHVHHAPQGVFGTVAAVNGTTTSGACGVAGMAGDFTLNGGDSTTFTVDVSATATMFDEHGVTTATFASVCVGDRVGALGMNSSGTVTATVVFVVPPPTPKPHTVFGTVASVNATSTVAFCPLADSTGVFTLTAGHDKTFTVDVGSATTFNEHGMPGATFANVCVGEKVGAVGLLSSGTVTATAVFVTPPPTPKPHAVFGTVASVNGTSTVAFCPLADSTGVFTLTAGHNKTFTVDVGSTTKFAGHGVSSPTFANVCVGGKVGAFGLVSSGTVTATAVFVSPVETSPPHQTASVRSKGSGPGGPSKTSHPTGHFQGHESSSGSGEGNQSHFSGNNSGHHDG